MTPAQVLKRLKELKEDYTRQCFKYTPEQQHEYATLLSLRRKRVKYFYDNDLVFKGPAKKLDKTNPKAKTP